METFKLVVVGDSGVGKTSLLIRYTTQVFPTEYLPTVFDNYGANIMYEGKPIQFGLWDPCNPNDSYDRLRPLSYYQTDIFLACYNVMKPNSINHLIECWIPEITHHQPETPYIIVGMKTDLREEIKHNDEQHALAMQHGAEYYLECSALDGTDVNQVFETALRVAVEHRKINHELKYYMFDEKEREWIKRNRQRFDRFGIYDAPTFIFGIIGLLIDMIISYVFVITIVNNDMYKQYFWIHFYIMLGLSLFVVCSYSLVILEGWTACYKNTCIAMMKSTVVIPLFIWMGLFIHIWYVLYRFIHIKFPMGKDRKCNPILWMDIFSILKLNEKKQDRNIRNNILKYNLVSRYIVKTDTTQMAKTMNYETSESVQWFSYEKRACHRFWVFDVFINLINYYHKHYTIGSPEYLGDQEEFCKYCIVERVLCGLSVILYPFYIFTQIGRLVLCILCHQYHFVWDILLSIGFMVLIWLWFKYVYKFHVNVWRMGYNNTIRSVSNGTCFRFLKDLDNIYFENVIIKTLLLNSYFSADIATIIHQFIAGSSQTIHCVVV